MFNADYLVSLYSSSALLSGFFIDSQEHDRSLATTMNHDLTQTQFAVVSLLVAGYNKSEIMDELTCTSKSLDNWLRQIKQKHGFKTLRQITDFYRV